MQKKKMMALAETLKHVEIEMIKGKAVITSVTEVLSHMLAVCLTEPTFYDSTGHVPYICCSS